MEISRNEGIITEKELKILWQQGEIEIACFKQFLLLLQCIQKLPAEDASTCVSIVGGKGSAANDFEIVKSKIKKISKK